MDRDAVLDRSHSELSIRRQCVVLGLARSGVYRPRPAAEEDDLAVMWRLDELFLAHPFLGSRRMAAMLRAEGRPINRKRVQRLMRLMGIAAIGPKPRTSRRRTRGHFSSDEAVIKLLYLVLCSSRSCSTIASSSPEPQDDRPMARTRNS
jgi:hypothetical protein